MSGIGHEIVLGTLLAHRDLLPAPARTVIPRAIANPDEAITLPAQAAVQLLKAGEDDVAEPSWGVLGRLLQEENFLNVRRMMIFQTKVLGVDSSDYLKDVMPLIADHPCRPYIEAMAIAPGTQRERLAELIKQWRPTDVEMTEVEVVDKFGLLAKPSNLPNESWLRLLEDRRDMLDHDLWLESCRFKDPAIPLLRREFSPDCHWAAAAVISEGWKTIRPNLSEWEKRYADHPDVCASLGYVYIAINKPEDAIRNLQASLQKGPDVSSYTKLANLYLRQGNEAKWLATFKECLSKEDYGLTHAQIEDQIAKHFMAKGEYETALPYTEAAAQSWAGWAMTTAADCQTALGHWDEAEQWHMRVAERYDDPITWYFWCQRPGMAIAIRRLRRSKRWRRGGPGTKDLPFGEITSPKATWRTLCWPSRKTWRNSTTGNFQPSLPH